MKKPRWTVGSLRGVPQTSGRGAGTPAPSRTRWLPPAPVVTRRGCCGRGCAGCPTGERIRAARARLPIA